MLNDSKIAAYTAILQEELLLATGCTEPIAVAYCAAKLREVLGGKPEKVLAEVSGNILKNVKSVVVPNTAGRPDRRAAGGRHQLRHVPPSGHQRRDQPGHYPPDGDGVPDRGCPRLGAPGGRRARAVTRRRTGGKEDYPAWRAHRRV